MTRPGAAAAAAADSQTRQKDAAQDAVRTIQYVEDKHISFFSYCVQSMIQNIFLSSGKLRCQAL